MTYLLEVGHATKSVGYCSPSTKVHQNSRMISVDAFLPVKSGVMTRGTFESVILSHLIPCRWMLNHVIQLSRDELTSIVDRISLPFLVVDLFVALVWWYLPYSTVCQFLRNFFVLKFTKKFTMRSVMKIRFTSLHQILAVFNVLG